MEKLKSYTDIEQSKKLAEILPLESADMNYWCGTQIRIGGHRTMDKDLDVPCWSLTALFSIMPQIHEWITPYGHKNDKLFQFEPKICKIWEHSIIPSYKVTYGNELSTDIYDNPIDACVDMILKLYELNLLHLSFKIGEKIYKKKENESIY